MTYVVGILFLGVRSDGSMLEGRDKVEFPTRPKYCSTRHNPDGVTLAWITKERRLSNTYSDASTTIEHASLEFWQQ
jgi:hypothetical protein